MSYLQGSVMPSSPIRTKLLWDFGTAYDLFLSLHVLHNPDVFGLKPSWAAGVRSRLPVEQRQTLELALNVMATPFYFVHGLPKPKTSGVVIEAISKIPAGMRLPKLYFRASSPKELREILHSTTAKSKWTRAEKIMITEAFKSRDLVSQPTILDQLHRVWSHRDEFGESYLAALKSYYENFFAEEEQRILPVLKQGLSHAQMRSGSLPLTAMLEELSSGVRYRDLEHITSVHLAPSFWGAPYLFYEELDNDAVLMLFNARPETMALIPGEIVPDTLINGLKSLADPTRLRILRHLAQSPQTAAELSRALRLRPPTVAHHMMELRKAGVVQVIVGHEGDRQYATRFDGFDTIQELLNHFVHGD
jgi:DNA-binding transcriptional ArsR family regulator